MVLVFDFDGTITDFQKLLLDLAKIYTQKHHLPMVSIDQARKLGLRGLIKHYHLSPLEVAKIILWGQHQFSKRQKEVRVISGLAPVLKSLSASHTLGIISSNTKKNINDFLISNDLVSCFSFVDTSPDLFGKHLKLLKLRKRLTAIDYYIGDETRDIQAAKKAGIKSIAVTWGFEHPDLLATSHPDYLINKPQDLLKIVNNAISYKP